MPDTDADTPSILSAFTSSKWMIHVAGIHHPPPNNNSCSFTGDQLIGQT